MIEYLYRWQNKNLEHKWPKDFGLVSYLIMCAGDIFRELTKNENFVDFSYIGEKLRCLEYKPTIGDIKELEEIKKKYPDYIKRLRDFEKKVDELIGLTKATPFKDEIRKIACLQALYVIKKIIEWAENPYSDYQSDVKKLQYFIEELRNNPSRDENNLKDIINKISAWIRQVESTGKPIEISTKDIDPSLPNWRVIIYNDKISRAESGIDEVSKTIYINIDRPSDIVTELLNIRDKAIQTFYTIMHEIGHLKQFERGVFWTLPKEERELEASKEADSLLKLIRYKPKFIRDERPSARNRVLVEIDTDILDMLWQKDKEYYLPRDKRTIDLSKPIVAPIVDFTVTGAISFVDGRHRFAALRDMGVDKVVVMVSPEDVPKFLEIGGRIVEGENMVDVEKAKDEAYRMGYEVGKNVAEIAKSDPDIDTPEEAFANYEEAEVRSTNYVNYVLPELRRLAGCKDYQDLGTYTICSTESMSLFHKLVDIYWEGVYAGIKDNWKKISRGRVNLIKNLILLKNDGRKNQRGYCDCLCYGINHISSHLLCQKNNKKDTGGNIMNEEIKRLEKRLKELKKKALRLQSESGCISCDLAVASSIIAQIYKDKEEGEKKRKLYLEGKITLGELFEGVDVNEDNKAAVEFIRNRFKYAMDLYFTDLD